RPLFSMRACAVQLRLHKVPAALRYALGAKKRNPEVLSDSSGCPVCSRQLLTNRCVANQGPAMPPVPPKTKTTPAQRFAMFHALRIDRAATKGDRDSAKHQMDNWLKRHKKTLDDTPEILEQARADDAVAGAPPPPPPPDPRAGTPHPYSGRRFSPADVAEHVIRRYVWMPEHVAVISTLWACFTHVYPRFAIAPRLALTSKHPNSGKSTL